MRFELIQHHDADADAVSRAYAEPGLYPNLVGLPKLGGIEVVAHDGPPVTRLEVRFRFTGHLPAAVTAVVHPDRLTWVQETIHDHAGRSARFRLLPDHYPDRLRCRGRFTITDRPGGSRRVVAGELQVRAPLVGGRVEQAIVSGLEEYLEAEAPVVDAWIRRSG
jgi:hypothetical protein